MVPLRRAGIKNGKMVSRWQEEFSRWDGKYLLLTSFHKENRNKLDVICRSVGRQDLPSRRETWRGFSVLDLTLDPSLSTPPHPSLEHAEEVLSIASLFKIISAKG